LANLVPASLASPALKTKAIEDIQLGDRVLGRNPELSDAERHVAEPDPITWRQVEFQIAKPDGGQLAVRLLRPRAWIEENHAWPGNAIPLVLPEFHLEARATVVALEPCPTVQAGKGHVVTGVFRHTVPGTLNLSVEGLDEPLGVTANHPFWSLDRLAFVPAGELAAGERVRRHDGASLRITGVERRPGPQAVCNIEVQGEHAYEVSNLGLLVHNAGAGNCQGGKEEGPNASGAKPSQPPLQRIHPDSTYAADATAKASLKYWRTRPTQEIVDSLKPGGQEPLLTKPDGRMMNGNTRTKVLQERGHDINSLPREVLPLDPLLDH
jgi:hypothetical protein